jgi:hypothetical protein
MVTLILIKIRKHQHIEYENRIRFGLDLPFFSPHHVLILGTAVHVKI